MKRWTDIHSDPDGWVEVDVIGVENIATRAVPKEKRDGYEPRRLKLSRLTVLAIRDAYSHSDDTLEQIASRFGVSRGTVQSIAHDRHSRRAA